MRAQAHILRIAGRPAALGAAGVAVGLALLLAFALVAHPWASSLAALALAALPVGLWAPERLRASYALAIGLLLLGYAFLGRGFAYLNLGGIHVGEFVLVLGLFCLLASRPEPRILLSKPWLLVAAFAAWGAARTLPFLAPHGLDAVRDGVVWGYAGFAVAAGLLLSRASAIERVPSLYARALPLFLIWVPLGVGLTRATLEHIPRAPGTEVALLHLKSGDAAVHLAGASAFLLLGLHRRYGGRRPLPAWQEWLLWIAWCLGILAVSNNRGGLLSIGIGLLVVVLLGRRDRWPRVLLAAAIVVILMLGLSVQIKLDGPRKVSVENLVASVASIIDPDSPEFLVGSRAWRLDWWSRILGYTLFGEHFWTGKGFGINLANDDGFQTDVWGSLRSPHNGHLTILARAGVPGLALWLALQAWFAGSLLRAHREARRAGRRDDSGLFLWLLAYWAAFMTNISFDVYLEGPQGGIWYWTQLGFGIALISRWRALRARQEEAAYARPAPGAGAGAARSDAGTGMESLSSVDL